MLISAADVYLILYSKWNGKMKVVVSCFYFEVLQTFANKLLSRCHCHPFPQCQEEWLQKWSLWWTLRLRVCNNHPEHHSRLLILRSQHLRPWGDNTAPNILLAIWHFSDSKTWKKYSCTFPVLWSSSSCSKLIFSLHYTEIYWMDVPQYCEIKTKQKLKSLVAIGVALQLIYQSLGHASD